MDTLKQRIIDFIKENQPVNEKKLKDGLGISTNACRIYRKQLRATGHIFVTPGSGCFISREDFDNWLKNGGGHEKISSIAKMGGRGANADGEAKRLIIEFLSKQELPVTAQEIYTTCNIPQKTAYRILATLSDDGTIGHDGLRMGRHYVIDADSDYCIGNFGVKGESVKAFAKYNPKKNAVVQAYLKSPARQRLMAVYGRME